MSDYSSEHLLQYLDAPLKILIFSVDEMIVLAVPAITGILMDWFFSGLVVSLAALWLLKKFKKKVGNNGSLQQVSYWVLPSKKNLARKSHKGIFNMKVNRYQLNALKLLRQRNSSLVFATGLLLSNLVLVCLVFSRSEKIVLVPPDIKQSLWLKGSQVSKSYLEEMALWFAHLMLDKNHQNQRYQHKMLLGYVLPAAHNSLVSKLMADEKRYGEEGLSTNFYPKQSVVDVAKNQVRLEGELVSRIGAKDVDKQDKTYLVQFYYWQGKWWLTQFHREKKDD